jgi:uncharacterized protein DUF5989
MAVLRSRAMARRYHGLRIARDLLRFALDNKKWWLVPVVAVSLVLVVLVVLSATPLAPFIYTVF